VQLAVLLGLAALWVAVLLPDFLRRRSTRRTGDSISNFTHHLSVLERSNPLAGSGRRSGRVLSPRQPRPMPTNVVQMTPRIARPRAGAVASPAAQTARPAPAARTGRPVGAPSSRTGGPQRMTRSQAQQRRQDVIVALSAAALLTLLATVAFGGVMLYLHLLVDLLFVAYLGLLLMAPKRAAKRPQVTYLTPAPARQPVSAAHQRSTVAR
jgi:hypothetical protein